MDSLLDSFWHSTDLNYFNELDHVVYKKLWYVEKNYPTMNFQNYDAVVQFYWMEKCKD